MGCLIMLIGLYVISIPNAAFYGFILILLGIFWSDNNIENQQR